jgi:O-antigen/teichoic acid export membrane protein
MRKKLLSASAILMAAFVASQILRFAGNVVLAKLLSPSAFGVVAVVNLLILALNLLSDVGLRLIVIQRQGVISSQFINTVWMLQIGRGVLIWALSLLSALVLRLLQLHSFIDATNAYADPTLPFLIVGAASAALFQGLESTKSLTERRELSLGRVTAIGLAAQIVAMILMIVIARITTSPWALVIGGVAAAFIQCTLSHVALPGERNRPYFDKSIAWDVISKGRWVFLSSMVSFLGGNADILMLGGLVDSASLGNYVVAFQLINVVQILSGTISGNVVFPALSAARRDNPTGISGEYRRIQLASDALIATAAGVFFTAGSAIVTLLFDHRYALAGQVLSCLALGVFGLRYYVVEQLMNADGNFRLTTIIAIIRLAALALGTYVGFRIGGLTGAAIGVGLSAFASWPLCIRYLAKSVGIQWRVELAAIGFVLVGSGLGLVLSKLIHLYK